ncbi:hypothetical protein [Vibrio sp. HN007]|uniref:hypothetical protein n=1 Tax=Vibrio iocasae TaxID=3098914 RepID=UPI0035D41FC6
MNNIEIKEKNIRMLSSGVAGNIVLRCLAMSWEDAKEDSTAKQQSVQRRMLIESAIEDYISRLTTSEVEALSIRLS